MLSEIGRRASVAARILGRASTEMKNNVLETLAEEIGKSADRILDANHLDIQDGEVAGLSAARPEA